MFYVLCFRRPLNSSWTSAGGAWHYKTHALTGSSGVVFVKVQIQTLLSAPSILPAPVFPECDHVVRTAGVVVEGILGQHELRVALELADVHGLPSCVIDV